MDEIKGLLGKVSEGLRALGDIFVTLGKHFEQKADVDKGVEIVDQPKQKETKNVRVKAAAPTNPKKNVREAKKRPEPQKKTLTKKKTEAKPVTTGPSEPVAAYSFVLDIIKASEKGADVAVLMDKTGFDSKKIANCVYKLKRNRMIKSTKKGVYTAV
jgi:hypothetical protein